MEALTEEVLDLQKLAVKHRIFAAVLHHIERMENGRSVPRE